MSASRESPNPTDPGGDAPPADVPGNVATTTDVSSVGDAVAGVSSQVSGLTSPDNSGIAAIKAKTDNLPASPAAVGSAMSLTSAYDAAKTAASASLVGTPAGASIAADIAAVQAAAAAMKAKTDNLPASPAAVGSAMALTAAAKQDIPRSQATAVLNAVAVNNVESDLIALGSAGGSSHFFLDSVYTNVVSLGTQTLLTFKLYVDLNGSESLFASATDASVGVVSVLQLLQATVGSGPIVSRRIRLSVTGNSGITPASLSGSVESRVSVA